MIRLLLTTSVLCLIFLSPTALGQQPLARGQIIEKVVCKAEPSLSYALYLPSSYSPDKKHPILYGFDPAARGTMPVERYKVAAETYGYIVVGSNDSRNGPTGSLNKIIRALWADTHERFAIDDRRVYTTGVSGGARIASLVANSLQGAVAGVIIHAAGFHQNVTPSKSLPFIVFAVIGNEDFNMPEVHGLDRKLDELRVTHRLTIFDGTHAWAPSENCVEAVEWMEVQAMKSGRATKNEALLDQLLQKQLEKARAYEASQNLYQAFLLYSAMAEDFSGVRDVALFEAKAMQLKETQAVKDQMRREREEDFKQTKYTNDFLALKNSLSEADNRAVALSEIKNLVSTLKKKADEKSASSDRLVARRTLGLLFIESFEAAQTYLFNKSYNAATKNLEVATLVRPDNARVFFQLARAYGLGGDKKKSLEALKKSVEKGFADPQAIDDEAFNSLRGDPEFIKLVENLKQKK